MPGSTILKGQTALVTGASSGIGAASAAALDAAGASVGINYPSGSKAAAEELVAQIHQVDGRAAAFEADVSKENEVRHMFAAFITAFGRLDILVANAGLQRDAAVTEMTSDEWRTVIDVNLTGQFLCAREAIQQFIRQKASTVSKAAGKVICMSSVHEVIPWAGHVNYAASKGGVMLMMKSIAQEVAPHRIRVNSVCPRAIRTPINTAAWSTAEAYASLMQLVPYKRIGEPEDIGRVVAWLASDEADYITGASIFVDGGMTLYPGFATGG